MAGRIALWWRYAGKWSRLGSADLVDPAGSGYGNSAYGSGTFGG